jgi:hypothetical protein
MKTQQRKFVVEIKSAGRRSVARQGSIWSNTNLKAFARQAASDAPQLFEAAQEPDTIRQDLADLPDGALVVRTNEGLGSGDAQQVAAPMPEAVPDQSPQSERVDAISSLESVTHESPSTNPPTPKRKKPIKRQAHRATSAGAFTTAAVLIGEPFDELATLDTENRRLKALLAEHIRQQNLRLREMLDRFDVF